MVGKFFKGFFLALLWVLIFVVAFWIFRFVVDVAVAAWGFAFGCGFWSVVLLVVCIIAGIVYMQRA